jgi:hypothetical protein
MAANFTYTVFTGVLVGMADRKFFHINALSGGGGGSTKHQAPNANNLYLFGLKTIDRKKNHIHGGPLPPGRYKIERPRKHPHLGLSARLIPASENSMLGRGGFYIHSRGPHGSDGCIVPLEKFKVLMDALEAEGQKIEKEKQISVAIVGTLFVREQDSGHLRFA